MENCNSTVAKLNTNCALKNDSIQSNNLNENLINEQNESVEKCTKWLLEKCTLNTVNSDIEFNSHIWAESTTTDDQSVFSENSENFLMQFENNSIEEQTNTVITKNDQQYYGDINISNSNKVIVGNVTYITGPIYITQSSSNVQVTNVTNQIFLNDSVVTRKAEKLRIISRLHWLAQPALSKTNFSSPIRHIIIAHTATEEGFTQAENVLLIRLLQTFHIEGLKHHDIAFNFMIGSDGNVYQGRGWTLEGEHTNGYNENSIAIAFVGCFINHLPTEASLNAAKLLIQHGIDLGLIPCDYILIGQSQCLPIESPGKSLIEEIKNWPNWKELS